MATAELSRGLEDASDLWQASGSFAPRTTTRMADWCCTHAINDEGRPYDHHAFPHLAAPGGPCDAVDDASVRTLSLQWATRLGKSFFGQNVLLKTADEDPCSMMLASESERSLKRIMGRVYASVFAIERLNNKLLRQSEKDNPRDEVRFVDAKIVGAWARSSGTLADENIKVGLANEYDKDGWDGRSTSKEASPPKLFEERFKDYYSVRKVIYESTPTIRGRSRIERRLIGGTNCRLYVPCPHCGKYQQLRFAAKGADGKYDTAQPGRIAWEKKDGRHDKDTARNTAHYICISGECEPIRDEHRAWMMRRGVWVPEGCQVKDRQAVEAVVKWNRVLSDAGGDGASLWFGWSSAPWITGRPQNDGPDASYQLSSLYALSLGWGDIAAEYVSCLGKPRDMQNFVNSWLGLTWELVQQKKTWEQLGESIILHEIEQGIIPAHCTIVTAAVDKQADGRHPYMIMAWNEHRSGHVVEYGELPTTDEVEKLLSRSWRWEDGGNIRIAAALFDSGFRPRDLADFVRRMRKLRVPLHPCKGSNTSLGVVYRISKQGKSSAMPGLGLVTVDTLTTQDWIDKSLHILKPPDAGCITIHSGSLSEHQDLLEQLLNDAPVDDVDSAGRDVIHWQRVDRNIPNDFRDTARYCYAAMMLATRGRPPRPRSYQHTKQQPQVLSDRIVLERPGGWASDDWR